MISNPELEGIELTDLVDKNVTMLLEGILS
jgi:hypothetical protein